MHNSHLMLVSGLPLLLAFKKINIEKEKTSGNKRHSPDVKSNIWLIICLQYLSLLHPISIHHPLVLALKKDSHMNMQLHHLISRSYYKSRTSPPLPHIFHNKSLYPNDRRWGLSSVHLNVHTKWCDLYRVYKKSLYIGSNVSSLSSSAKASSIA